MTRVFIGCGSHACIVMEYLPDGRWREWVLRLSPVYWDWLEQEGTIHKFLHRKFGVAHVVR